MEVGQTDGKTGGQMDGRTFDSPVKVKGCDLSIVSFKVREVEEVRWGLLFSGLPAETQEDRRGTSVLTPTEHQGSDPHRVVKRKQNQ